MKKLKNFTKQELEKITEMCNKWVHPKTGKTRYYLNTIQMIEYYGNIFKFESEDYEIFLNSKVWIEGKEVFTDNANKNILLKISENLYKTLEF